MSTNRTAQGRDLVLSDDQLDQIEAAWPDLGVYSSPSGDAIRRLLREVRRQRSALRQVRAAIEGRTSVNVSVILSALGEQE